MLRHTLAGVARTGLRAWRAVVPGGPPGFRILLFHDIPEDLFAAFDRFVGHVKDTHGVITPTEVAAWIGGGTVAAAGGRTPCLFSFDDGFHSNYLAAREILGRHGVKGLFFVCPGLIDTPPQEQPAAIAATVFDDRIGAADLPPGLRLMDWQELAELADMGHTIGAHGMTHCRLSMLRGDDLVNEVVAAGDRLAATLGREVAWYATAFGDIHSVSAPALDVVARRYRFCRSGVRGINTAATHPMAVLADNVDAGALFSYQQLVAEGGLAWRYAGARRRLDRMVTG